MACSFIQSLLAAAVSVVVAGTALAQEPLKEAVNLIRLGKDQEAKAKLREILQGDPSNAEALKLYQSVSQDEYFMMLTGTDEEIRKIAQSILDRAKTERKDRSRDVAAIRDLVDAATAASGDHGSRQAAINKLISMHGEFAVPALVEKLANADDQEGQIQAIYTLTQLRTVAVLPLIEVLKSNQERTVENAAAALHMIGDDRAAPAMAHLANDSRNGVSSIGKRFLAAKNIKGSAVDHMLALANQYLRGVVPAGGHSEVVWSLVDDKLVATDVNPLLYSIELAKSCASDAMKIAPQSQEAVSMFAQANLAQSNLIQAAVARGDESLKAVEPLAAELKIAALATGLPALRSALDAGVAKGLAPVAMGAIEALGMAESAETIGQSSLQRALESTDKRIRYAAAQALVQATRGVAVPSAERVVAVLAEAVAEQSVRTIHVIDPTQEAKVATKAAGGVRSMTSAIDASAVDGMRSLLINPNVDVVVINEILPDRLPEDVIGNIKKDSRMANTKIIVIAKDGEAAKTRFGDAIHGTVAAPLSGENLVAEVNRVLDGVPNPGGERGEAYAKGASEALLAVATNSSRIDGALESLAMQLDRADAVAVPAAQSLGLAGNDKHFDKLTAAMTSGSDAVKRAAAEAIGHILSRGAACPATVADALIGVVSGAGDVALRTAAAGALGKAKLAPEKTAEVQQKLRKVAGAPRAEG